ncbi:porin family protein [Geomonas sp. RF6]|uniref:outer membrane beta-barrel protein n=1 Tax=Geomonas sp. RF6 TaxID=2897342 RepID=UPI001E3084A5|nr:outer membrane beta-barrel protein [Geomonas sp. RF6]UFS70016.1 porin family protein [Geomonas sp. RF6]
MRKWKALLAAMTFLALAGGVAHAGSIEGRFGITGQLGFTAAQKSSYTPAFAASHGLTDRELKPDGGFIGGGSLMFGLTPIVALEAGALYQPDTDYQNGGVEVLSISSTDVYVGFQLRNNVSDDLAAYLGAGVDVLFSDVEDVSGRNGDVDTVVGGHVHVGGDYFITPSIALNLDLRALLFPDADVKSAGSTVANFSPITFVGLFGVRFFLN